MDLIQWGTVPAWLSAVAVPLALYIILRDKRKDAREQAREVVAWSDYSTTAVLLGLPADEAIRYVYRIAVLNNSSSVILKPVVRLRATSTSKRLKRLKSERGQDYLPDASAYPGPTKLKSISKVVFPDPDVFEVPKLLPKQSVTTEISLKYSSDNYEIYFDFTDASGSPWRLDVRTNELVRFNSRMLGSQPT